VVSKVLKTVHCALKMEERSYSVSVPTRCYELVPSRHVATACLWSERLDDTVAFVMVIACLVGCIERGGKE
jgi:hypothetical protein